MELSSSGEPNLHVGDDAKNFASWSIDNVDGRMRAFNVDPHRE